MSQPQTVVQRRANTARDIEDSDSSSSSTSSTSTSTTRSTTTRRVNRVEPEWNCARKVVVGFIAVISMVGLATMIYFFLIRGEGHFESEGSMYDEDQLMHLIRSLVKQPSATNNPHGLDRAIRYIGRYLRPTKWSMQYMNSDDEPQLTRRSSVYNLLVSSRPVKLSSPSHFKLLLLTHIDVYPPITDRNINDHDLWTLSGDQSHRIYGRGVAEMKASLAAILYHMRRMVDVSHYDIALIVTSDSLRNGHRGVGYALSELKISADVVIVPGQSPDGWSLITQEKGVLQLNITTSRASAHTSRPWEAENPVHLLMKDVQSILDLQHRNENNEIVENVKLCENSDGSKWHTTCTLSNIQSVGGNDGVSIDQQPAVATATLDVRFTEPWRVDTLLKYIRSAVSNSDIDIIKAGAVMNAMPPTIAGRSRRDYVAEAKELIESETKSPVTFGKSSASSDGRFASEAQIPVIRFGPRCEYTPTQEWLDFRSLTTFHHIIAKMFDRWGR